jgi:hypothetical protein
MLGGNTREQLYALLHDAHEMVTGDIPTPWNTAELDAIQSKADGMIWDALGLRPFEEDEMIRTMRCDRILLEVEAKSFMPRIVLVAPDWFNTIEDVGVISYAKKAIGTTMAEKDESLGDAPLMFTKRYERLSDGHN